MNETDLKEPMQMEHLQAAPPPPEHEETPGPRPVGTLVVIAILLLVTIAFWMMVLGIQQARA